MCILAKESQELEEIIKRKWKVVYKCRNCGKLFEKTAHLVDFSVPANITLAAHKCTTGVYGYGDIQSSVTCDDESWEDETGSKDYIPFENEHEEKSK